MSGTERCSMNICGVHEFLHDYYVPSLCQEVDTQQRTGGTGLSTPHGLHLSGTDRRQENTVN